MINQILIVYIIILLILISYIVYFKNKKNKEFNKIIEDSKKFRAKMTKSWENEHKTKSRFKS